MNLAAVYSREMDGKPLTLAPSGWTYDYTFVLYDRETETLWYPFEKGLMGIQGIHFKRWLPLIPSEDTRWKRWKARHPDSRLLD